MLKQINDLNQKVRELVANQMPAGVGALVVQDFNETHCKLGKEYEVAFFNPTLLAGNTNYLHIQTGSEPMTIQGIDLKFSEEEISAQLFRGPTGVSGGVPLPVYSLNDSQPNVNEATITALVNVSSEGTPVSPEIVSLGNNTGFFTAFSTLAFGEGVIRILAPNSSYLYAIKNRSSGPTKISGIATWYEGPLDIS